jgi:hypothetical protein
LGKPIQKLALKTALKQAAILDIEVVRGENRRGDLAFDNLTQKNTLLR